MQLLQNKVNELTNLLEAFKQLNSHIEIQDVFENILWQMMIVVKAEAGTLWVVEKGTEDVVATAAHGIPSSSVLNKRKARGEGIVGKVIATGEVTLIEDVTKHPHWTQRLDTSESFIKRSMIIVPLIAKGHVLGALQLINKKDTAFFNEEDISLAVTLANQSALAIHHSQMYEEINMMFLSMIKTLVKSIDARDPYTAGHSERVAKYAVWIAERLGVDEATCGQLYKAALLHDIGKIGIPDHILLKRGRLTDEEFDTIKQHTVIGASILSNMEPKHALTYAIQIARSHHEKMNGSGYPDGLKGEDIPFFARIVCVADAFDAMTTVRPYSNGFSYEKAAEELIRCRGLIFDETVVDAFTAILEEIHYEVATYKPQNKHSKAFL